MVDDDLPRALSVRWKFGLGRNDALSIGSGAGDREPGGALTKSARKTGVSPTSWIQPIGEVFDQLASVGDRGSIMANDADARSDHVA